MKKFITILILLLVIITATGFSIIKLGSLGADDNYFNRTWRNRVAAYPAARKIFSLHHDGDAKADYLGKRFNKIVIEVDSMEGLTLSHNVLDTLVDRIEKLTGKETSYYISDQAIEPAPYTDASRISSVVTAYKNRVTAEGAATLYVLNLNQGEAGSTIIGETYKEYGLLLYDEPLQDFTRDAKQTLEAYQLSTLLHEFGHQLGLDHNDEVNCLMNPEAEMSLRPKRSFTDVVTEFCDREREQINSIKSSAASY